MKKILLIILFLLSFVFVNACEFKIETVNKNGDKVEVEGGESGDDTPITGEEDGCEIEPYTPIIVGPGIKDDGLDPIYDIRDDGYGSAIGGIEEWESGKGTYDMPGGMPGKSYYGDGSGFGDYQSGQLTARALFDNNNYEDFLKLLGISYDEEQNEVKGEFYSYQEVFKLHLERITLHLENGPLTNVELLDGDKVLFSAKSDRNGLCYLFTNHKEETYKVRINGHLYDVHDGDTITLEEENNVLNNIELMFVIDTTGSMGDEINYLKVEIKDVIERVCEENNVDIKLSLLFYRDQGDEYVIRYFDFTDDIDLQVENLGKQRASGGGDFPEAVEEAMQEASSKQWSSGNNTKILVHVADAPSHDKDVETWFDAVDKFAEKGIRVVEVASSGIDKKTEFLFRSQAIMTNGVYAYLTNHSGIGGNHLEASTEEDLPVEHLNDLLVRVINGIYSGEFAEPVALDIPDPEEPTDPVDPVDPIDPILPDEPELPTLDPELRDELIEKYYNYLEGKVSLESIVILNYLGTYNGASVALFDSSELGYLEVITYDEIKDVRIMYPNSNTIKVVIEDKVISLLEAYEHEILTLDEIREIAILFGEPSFIKDPVIC